MMAANGHILMYYSTHKHLTDRHTHTHSYGFLTFDSPTISKDKVFNDTIATVEKNII